MAARAREAAAKMSSEDAKSVMLEVAESYERRAGRTRTIAAMMAPLEDKAR
jgi:hypothetical protein